MVSLKERPKSAEQEQYLPDGEGGDMAPPRCEAIEKRIEIVVNNKLRIAELREEIKVAKQELIEIGDKEGYDSYRHTVGEKVYELELVLETKASIRAAKTE